MHIGDKEKFKETEYLFPFLHLSKVQTTDIEMEVAFFIVAFARITFLRNRYPR